MLEFVSIVSGYILGSIPVAYCIAKLRKGIDIREVGVRNVGSGSVFREATAPVWDEWVRRGYITAPKLQMQTAQEDAVMDVRETVTPDEHQINIEFNDPYHMPHLSNFFNSVRGLETLNCPAEIGYETAVAVLKVNEAIEARRTLEIKPEEYHV